MCSYRSGPVLIVGLKGFRRVLFRSFHYVYRSNDGLSFYFSIARSFLISTRNEIVSRNYICLLVSFFYPPSFFFLFFFCFFFSIFQIHALPSTSCFTILYHPHMYIRTYICIYLVKNSPIYPATLFETDTTLRNIANWHAHYIHYHLCISVLSWDFIHPCIFQRERS